MLEPKTENWLVEQLEEQLAPVLEVWLESVSATEKGVMLEHEWAQVSETVSETVSENELVKALERWSERVSVVDSLSDRTPERPNFPENDLYPKNRPSIM